MAFFSEFIVCAACLCVWLGLAALVVGLLCLIFGADKIADTVERGARWFGFDD